MPGAEHIILSPHDGWPLPAKLLMVSRSTESGDLVFPHGDQHVLASADMGHLRPVEIMLLNL
jgi:hypothetical protein